MMSGMARLATVLMVVFFTVPAPADERILEYRSDIQVRQNGQLVESTWDEALGLVASRFQEIKDAHGANAIGGFASARCTNEENYLFQKFFRAVIGTNNIDHCARL